MVFGSNAGCTLSTAPRDAATSPHPVRCLGTGPAVSGSYEAKRAKSWLQKTRDMRASMMLMLGREAERVRRPLVEISVGGEVSIVTPEAGGMDTLRGCGVPPITRSLARLAKASVHTKTRRLRRAPPPHSPLTLASAPATPSGLQVSGGR